MIRRPRNLDSRTCYLKRTARAKMLTRRLRNLDTRTRYLKRTARARMVKRRVNQFQGHVT